jgi:PadR family transcriptional regulator, regulatory protein PadR
MPSVPPQLFQGTLDVLILRTLAWGPRHGYAVARWIEETTAGALAVEDASLYTSLHRLEAHGWVESEWGLSDRGKRAKFYRLTSSGRAQLTLQMRQWSHYADAVSRVLQPLHPLPSAP